VTLTATHPYCFKIYLDSLYNNAASLLPLAQACHADFAISHAPILFKEPGVTRHILCELWALGDFLGDDEFCNRAINGLIQANLAQAFCPAMKTLHLVVEETAAGSPLRHWLIESSLPYLEPDQLNTFMPRWPQQLQYDLLRTAITNKDSIGTSTPIQLSAAPKYHKRA
jgi:hypothetical protein